jgi:putative redox protein
MKTRVDWVDGMAFRATTESGHAIDIDGPPDLGGQEQGARPMELLLAGLGSCSAVDVVHILRKGRHEVTDCTVDVSADRADVDPKVFTAIHLHFRVTGRALREAAVARAVELSAEKYCSASIMLGKAAEITHGYEVVAA